MSKSILIPVDDNKIISYLSNVPNILKKPLSYGTILSITSFFTKIPESLLKYLPQTSYFSNDYTLTDQFKHSKLIPLYSIIDGRYKNLYTSIAIPFEKKHLKDFKKFILDSQDLTCVDGVFTYPKKIFNEDIDIRILNQNNIYINNILYENCSDEQRKEALDMVYVCQRVQHTQVHYFGTFGYNLLMSSNINNHSPLLKLILSYGKDIRNLTEGFTFPGLFIYNTIGVTNENVIRTLDYMPTRNDILFQNLLENKTLQLQSTIDIYKIFINVISHHITKDDINQISEKCNLDHQQVHNFLINVIFFMSFFHTWTHKTLENSDQDHYITTGSLNQYNYGIITQHQTDNSIIKELRDQIEKMYPGLGKYVMNIHK